MMSFQASNELCNEYDHQPHHEDDDCNQKELTSANVLGPVDPLPEIPIEQHRHKRRRIQSSVGVRFMDTTASLSSSTITGKSTIATVGFLTDEDKRRLWYQKDELLAIKLEARDCILGGGGGSGSNSSRSGKQQGLDGLERFDLDRVKNKALAKKCILKAYRCGYRDKDLANLAKHCTASAREQALRTGYQDSTTV
eukprot:scaffold1192_cov58-Cylindrotheca_fusiformis.AAC.2